MYLRVYGLLVVGRHKPRGLLVRLDRGDLNLLDQLYLVLAFFRSRKKTNNRIHNLRGKAKLHPRTGETGKKSGLHFQSEAQCCSSHSSLQSSGT